MIYPATDTQIESPHQLTTLLREIKSALAEGILEQFTPAAAAAVALDDLNAVKDTGPWPDYLEAYLRNPKTDVRYKLTVETYHGVGGSWQRLENRE
jgi:hypothetical protein